MAQVFRPAANTIALLVIASLGAAPILLIGIGYSLMRSSYVTDQSVTREQPVPFSHAHHVGGLGLDCRYCHTSVTTARFAGIPPTETCMTCHSQLWTNAAMLAPVRESLAANKPIHWQRVHVLPDYVYFDHQGLINRRLAADLHYANVSDPAYFEDLGGDHVDLSSISFLDRSARLIYQSPAAYSVQLLVQDYQEITSNLTNVEDKTDPLIATLVATGTIPFYRKRRTMVSTKYPPSTM